MLRKIGWALLLLVIIGYPAWSLTRPLPVLQAVAVDKNSKSTKDDVPNIDWSGYGSQAVGAVGVGVMATKGKQTARPIASVAKTMVALAVLKEKPLKLDQTGPKITFTAQDEALYKRLYSENHSVVAVKAGSSLSQYQALQGMLIASGNNLAIKMAEWAFGSIEDYTTYANKLAKDLGMTKSRFADASGFDPKTVSTAHDLVLLGIEATQQPVIAKIVKQQSATLPVAGKVLNYNTTLGTTKLNGIKTGSTDQAGGCFLFSTKFKDTTLVGAIVGAPDRGTALYEAPLLTTSFSSKLDIKDVVKANQTVAHYQLPWGKRVEVVASEDLSVVTWRGSRPKPQTDLQTTTAGRPAGQSVGKIKYALGDKNLTTSAVLKTDVPRPSLWWRLLHP